MAEINPKTLKKWRIERELTLDELAEKAEVDKQTIHRLERGQVRKARETTLTRLAKALGVDPEILAQPVSDEGDGVPRWEPDKSQFNRSISNQARNALLLVSERYHVRPAQVIELAPLLFNWAAEKSLRRRLERIEALQQRESEISKELERFSSELGDLTDGPAPEIELPDYLGDFLSQEMDGPLQGYLFSEFGSGPIGDLLDELVTEIGDEAEFGGWHANSSPTYGICKEEATWLADRDEVALENILQGYTPLHELPEEFWEQLRNRNTVSFTDSEEFNAVRQQQAAERVAWLREHGRPDDTREVAS